MRAATLRDLKMQDLANDGWQELHLPTRDECPKLFYSFHTTKDSFSLLLTDLIAIWDCSLDKYDILAEAARQDASIDPSESARQLGLLLSKLREGLQHKNGHNVLARDSNHLSRNLLLRTKVDLPRPLKPLNWIFRLEQKNASELAEQLLRPSLHEVSVSQDKITSLLHTIKEKDHVISRVLDRIKTSGIDLGLDFPSFTIASSRKGGQLSVADAKKHVPGMAEFDYESWIKQFSNEDGYEGADRTGLKNLVKGCEKCFVHTREQHEDWLSGLTTSDNSRAILSGGINAESGLDRGGAVTLSSKGEETPTEPDVNDDDDDDDDFERQPTPPKRHLKDAGKQGTRSPARGGDTETESDDDMPKKKTTTSRLGNLGRRNATKAYGDSKAKPRSSPAILRRPASPPLPYREASATATESDSEAGSHPHRKKSKGPLKAPPKQKARLGGLKKPSDKKSPPSSPSEDEGYAPPKTSDRQKACEDTKTPDPDSSPAPSSNHQHSGRLNKTKQPPPSRSASSTPEADDLDGSSPRQTRGSQKHQPPPKAQSPPPPRRLGRLGGLGGGRKAKASSASASASPQPASSKKKTPGKSTSDVDMTDGDTPSPSPSPSSKPTTRQRTNHTSPSPSPKKSSPSTSKAKSTAKQDEGAAAAEEKAPEQEETDEAKANRRREELKRSIASGAGVRKKRRF